MADEHDLDVVEVCKPVTIALSSPRARSPCSSRNCSKIRLDVIAGLRPLLVPRDLDDLPGLEVRVDLPLERSQLPPEPADLFGDLGRIARQRGFWRTVPPAPRGELPSRRSGSQMPVADSDGLRDGGGILGHASASRIGF